MLNYLHGYMFGIPALMLIQILGPTIVMDGGKKLFSQSALVLCAADVTGDLLNAMVFHGGNFGMGLATAFAFIIQFLMIMSHFFKKNRYFLFSLQSIQPSHIKAIAFAGAPSFFRKLATVLRDLLINRMNLAVALSTAAVAARGVQNDLNTLMFCIGLGVGRTLLSMTGIYFGVQDKNGLKRLFATAIKTGILLSGSTALICFFSAGAIADFYMDNPEAISLAVFSIRCMAVSLLIDTLLVLLQDYLQGIGNQKLLIFLNFGERLFIPVLTAFVLGSFFGSKGIMASMAIGKILLGIVVLAIVCIHCRRFPRSLEDFMFLPKGFGGADTDSQDMQLNNMDDVMHESRMAEQFCLVHGADTQKARWMMLFVEEMAGNIILHGKPHKSASAAVDCRLFVHEGRICLSLRDYCEYFDPTRYYEIHQNDAPGESTGIRMVMKLAKEVRYYNAFNSNNLLVYLD